MLTDEESLRNDLRNLSKRAAAMARHASYDRQITEKCERHSELSRRVQQHLNNLTDLSVKLRASRAGMVTLSAEEQAAACANARQILQAFEEDHDDLAELTAEAVELMVARAELGAVPVDREAIAAGIEMMDRNLELLNGGLSRCQKDVSDLCDEQC